ncbi:MAG: M48 family metallopeptidase [Gammaproteobacteria bacterium]|jgi:Zn-dependent protease with chaperone function
MNFFEAQAVARRNTFTLVVLFVLAVVSLIVITNLLVMAVMVYNTTGHLPNTWEALSAGYDTTRGIGIGVVIILIIGAGSFYKTSVLASGGKAVAEILGGRVVPQNSQDPVHRKVLNVVEEMAIASGSPVPSVYLLDESGINAFAAGWSPSNAAIGITRGAVTYLTRDELQGVIAHEFSHIFNGDMRLNIRLIGVLHGILLLGMIGYFLMRSVRYVGRSRNKQGGSLVVAILILGVGLTVIGYCGTFFGNWIKAIVSRQREYLADASAVQFTRQSAGIAGALKKIGGWQAGSQLLSPSAPEYSHAYFSNGIASFLFATHPPLKDRIRRIEPRWDGKFLEPKREMPAEQPQVEDKQARKEALMSVVTAGEVGAAVEEAMQAIDRIGQTDEQQINYAQGLLAEVPPLIREEAEDPFGVRALIYCYVIHHSIGIQNQQWDLLAKNADPMVFEKAQQLHPQVSALPAKLRLPVFELCMPALKSLSSAQYVVFKRNIEALIQADRKVDIREWIVQRVIVQQLDEAFGIRKPPVAVHTHIGAVKYELELILSLVAFAEHKDEGDAHYAFATAIRSIGATALQPVARQQITIAELDKAMDKLERVKPMLKPRILKALVSCLTVDNKIKAGSAEFTRAVASCLGTPMPPITIHG